MKKTSKKTKYIDIIFYSEAKECKNCRKNDFNCDPNCKYFNEPVRCQFALKDFKELFCNYMFEKGGSGECMYYAREAIDTLWKDNVSTIDFSNEEKEPIEDM